MRGKLLALAFGLCLILPAAAAAEELPPYEGAQSFPAIEGPEGPESFSWEMNLDDDQELRQLDERHAAVFYTDPEHLALLIEAAQAHDATGSDVPTTLAVTQPNIVTLTVHHRPGNPAGGAPFDYPVTAGAGWEGGFQVFPVQGPPSEQPPAPVTAPSPLPSCRIPSLVGRTVKASRRVLQRAGCKLGRVRGERTGGARVLKQFRAAGKAVPRGTTVAVKLAG